MKKISIILLAIAVAAGCMKEERLIIQNTLVPGGEEELAQKADYFAKLREYKESDHKISYVFMGRYATLEGASNLNIEYTTMEHRFLALPDSLDVVNLWMGAPTDKPHSDFCWFSAGMPDYQFDYSPVAYADMQYCRKNKGTKFVLHADASHWGQQFQLINWNESTQQNDTTVWTLSKNKQDSHEAYAEFLYRKCLDYNIDGLDFDYEGWEQKHINWVIDYLAPKMGPNAETEEGKKLLLIVDYWSSNPPTNCWNKCSYIVRQAYSVQLGINSNSSLTAPGDAKKYIICEQWEQGNPINYTQGGKKWSNPSKNEFGEDLYSLEAYALFCKQGGAKGFGAYYIDNDYKYSVKSARGTFNTYGYLRNAIRAANPLPEASAEEETE